MSYYNTNKETGPTLFESNRKAKSQEDIISRWLRKYPGYWGTSASTPDYVHKLLFHPKGVPVTSIRRAFTNLCKKGVLEKTDKMIEGYYGKKVHTYKVL